MPDGGWEPRAAADRQHANALPGPAGPRRAAGGEIALTPRARNGEEPSAELFAEVAFGSQVGGQGRLYTYRVPPTLADALQPGHLVETPFGSRVLQGLVVATSGEQTSAIRLREINAILDPVPCLTPLQLELAHWMAGYYGCTLDDALSLMLPPGVEREPVAEYGTAPGAVPEGARLTALQQDLLRAVAQAGPATAARLAHGRDYAQTVRALEALARRKLLTRTVHLGRTAVAERTEQIVVLQPGTAARLTARQQQVVTYLQAQGGEARLAQLRADLGVDTALVMRLQERRVVLTYARQVRRDPLAQRTIRPNPAPPLTAEQAMAYTAIEAALGADESSVFLLHGITGSGKTEVYLRAVAATIARGRQALVLVPEIGLTPQTVARFAGRFPGRVALLHSRLSAGERYDEWQRIRNGTCDVVVGPRSALFSPVAAPGLIVLDEEHDGSYKQDRTPRYHARDAAIQLAAATGATVILGSATPDVTSYNRADRGEYRLLRMTSRVHHATTPPAPSAGGCDVHPAAGAGLPPVQVVDMRLELKAGNRGIFSRALLQAMERTFARREQAILLLNRRGNATFVNCRDCGRVVKCIRCDLPFAYHSDGEHLQCHRCDAHSALPTICAGCGSWRIRYFGLGTQKVEQEIAMRFPAARVQRYDRDVISGKLGHEQILERFARREADILIGTQIVAKGLDFPAVTLVGVISADTSLNLPDFRAAERTFQLLTQVAGRAGRAALPGRVIVQTYTPGHFAIQAAARHDYAAFYRDELRFRLDGNYPPYCQLLRLTYSARSDAACREEATRLAGALERWLDANAVCGLELLGPAPCFINKANNSYFWQILVRGPDVHPILPQIPSGWAIDVDPMSML
ncbi:MAG TPA: primosomal protein N' [Chloroflexota bacterium]|nr:primosomal protein N' [Chloroflexota bacterium]